jgi:signal transduction histidine kinase
MQRPDTLDSRTILRCYTVAAGVVGLVIVLYRWPSPATLTADRISMAALWSLVLVATGNAVWLSGAVAWQFADIEHPARRLRALRLFAAVLILVGAFYWAPAFSILRSLFPAGAGWLPIAAGVVLLMASLQPRVFTRGSAAPRSVVTFHDVAGLSLRSRYDEQIRQAARQEERARLARDLHDAVKQQLFAVQTAAATAETRFDMDSAGARAALAQVRASTREALTEMEVMLDQLQAAPLTIPGLIESLTRAAEALRFRTGADVTMESGDLPPDLALPPGTHQAMLRFAQEALANVARHSRARHVRVRFGLDPQWTPPGSDRRRFVLSISDDGQGFDLSAASPGMGLRNMAARAVEAGGAMELASTPGHGTTVTLSIVNEVASVRRYAAYTVLALAYATYVVLRIGVRRDWQFFDLLWVLVTTLVVARFAVAAYRVRSWR